MNSSQTARTSPGLSGPFQLAGVGNRRSRVAGRSRRCKVAHNTGRSAMTSTRSKWGSVAFILPFYPPPSFPKTTPNTSEPQVFAEEFATIRSPGVLDLEPHPLGKRVAASLLEPMDVLPAFETGL